MGLVPPKTPLEICDEPNDDELVRCGYCRNVYHETKDRCPSCGAWNPEAEDEL